MECPVCMEAYDSTAHVPLVLQCGHTLCAACVRSLPKPRQCPLDRMPDTRRLSAIPRNYALLEAATESTRKKQQQQQRHNTQPVQGRAAVAPGALDASQLQFSPTMLGRSSGGVASVVQGTYRGKQVRMFCTDTYTQGPTAIITACVRAQPSKLQMSTHTYGSVHLFAGAACSNS